MTERDGPMTPKAFHALFGRIGARTKMQFSIHPHMLRHGCGYPAALPAIVVGRAGLVVIDCDRHPGGNDGIKAFNELVSANGGNLANVPMTKNGPRRCPPLLQATNW